MLGLIFKSEDIVVKRKDANYAHSVLVQYNGPRAAALESKPLHSHQIDIHLDQSFPVAHIRHRDAVTTKAERLSYGSQLWGR
jgi:hypothetical protein